MGPKQASQPPAPSQSNHRPFPTGSAPPLDGALGRLLFDHCHEGVLIASDGRIIDGNPEALRISGYPHAELLDQPLANLILESPQWQLFAQTEAAATAVQDRLVTLQRKDGQAITVALSIFRLNIEPRPAILLLLTDKTRPPQTESELLKTRQLESIAALSGGIAHDYNNLLAAIIGNLSLSLIRLERDHVIRHLLHEALDASQVAKELTQKLITFSKGGEPLTRVAAIKPILKSATDFALSGSNIRPEYSFANELWLVDINANQIMQAIHSIVLNARGAMPEGGAIQIYAENLRLAQACEGLAAGDYVHVSIHDHGCGIATENLDRVFDPYFTTKTGGTLNGMGLGLSISQSIIHKHRGEIRILSRTGLGTTVHIYLPASRQQSLPAAEPGASLATPAIEPHHGHGRVLVMDDDERIREMMADMLEYLGYEAVFVTKGEEALAAYGQALRSGKPFNAVMLDLTIRGGMGGKQTIGELLQIDPHVKAIVSSGYSDDPVMSDHRRYGFTGIVAKPYSIAELGAVLHLAMTQPT